MWAAVQSDFLSSSDCSTAPLNLYTWVLLFSSFLSFHGFHFPITFPGTRRFFTTPQYSSSTSHNHLRVLFMSPISSNSHGYVRIFNQYLSLLPVYISAALPMVPSRVALRDIVVLLRSSQHQRLLHHHHLFQRSTTGAAASVGLGISCVMTWVRWVKRGRARSGGTTVYTKHATATTSSIPRNPASNPSRRFMVARGGGGGLGDWDGYRGKTSGMRTKGQEHKENVEVSRMRDGESEAVQGTEK